MSLFANIEKIAKSCSLMRFTLEHATDTMIVYRHLLVLYICVFILVLSIVDIEILSKKGVKKCQSGA